MKREEIYMSLIKCPECGKEISSKAVTCPFCGCPSSEWAGDKQKGIDEVALEIIEKYSIYERGRMIEELREKTGLDLRNSRNLIEKNLSVYISKNNRSEKTSRKEFNGIYKYGLLGGKYEVYCPRCGSENCSY